MGANNDRFRERLAWAAGLFEGEGCVGLRSSTDRPGARALTVQLRTTDLDVLVAFREVLGVGAMYGPHAPRKAHHKASWTWCTTTFEHGQYVIAALWPWMGVRRRAKIVESLGGYINRPTEARAKMKPRKASLTQDDYREMRRLRSEGVSQADIARRFDSHQSTVSLIVRGLRCAA